MDINETMAREIAQQLGIGGGGARVDQDMIRRLEGKSDTELMQELARLQSLPQTISVPRSRKHWSRV